MVIPICFKCQNPLELVSRPEDGIEIVRYQCPQCQHSSASFLLGYTEPDWPKPDGASLTGESNRRAQAFMGVHKQYKLRAKVQAFLDTTSHEARRRSRSISELRDVE